MREIIFSCCGFEKMDPEMQSAILNIVEVVGNLPEERLNAMAEEQAAQRAASSTSGRITEVATPPGHKLRDL